MANDPEHRRDVVQHLGDVLAQPTQRAAAFRTGAGCGMFLRLARQVFGKWPACRFAPSDIPWRSGAASSCGAGGAVSAICSSRSPRLSSSCSIALRNFSDEAPNRWRSSVASRSFSCSLRSTCSCNPLRAAWSSAACSASRASNNARSAAMSGRYCCGIQRRGHGGIL